MRSFLGIFAVLWMLLHRPGVLRLELREPAYPVPPVANAPM
jgi:hypothetical protein